MGIHTNEVVPRTREAEKFTSTRIGMAMATRNKMSILKI